MRKETRDIGFIGGSHVLLRFYRRETLMSERARLGWVEPDVAPLAWSAV